MHVKEDGPYVKGKMIWVVFGKVHTYSRVVEDENLGEEV